MMTTPCFRKASPLVTPSNYSSDRSVGGKADYLVDSAMVTIHDVNDTSQENIVRFLDALLLTGFETYIRPISPEARTYFRRLMEGSIANFLMSEKVILDEFWPTERRGARIALSLAVFTDDSKDLFYLEEIRLNNMPFLRRVARYTGHHRLLKQPASPQFDWKRLDEAAESIASTPEHVYDGNEVVSRFLTPGEHPRTYRLNVAAFSFAANRLGIKNATTCGSTGSPVRAFVLMGALGGIFLREFTDMGPKEIAIRINQALAYGGCLALGQTLNHGFKGSHRTLNTLNRGYLNIDVSDNCMVIRCVNELNETGPVTMMLEY